MAVPLFDRVFRFVLCTLGWLMIVGSFGLAAISAGMTTCMPSASGPAATGAMSAAVFAPVLLLGIAAAVRLWPRRRKWRGLAILVGLYVLWVAAVTSLAAVSCSYP